MAGVKKVLAMTTLLSRPIAANSVDSTETMGDLLKQLGGISPDRVRLHPTPGTATVQDVVAIQQREKRLFELVNGILVEKGMGYAESVLALAIASALRDWALPRKLGVISGESGMMQLVAKQVRMPDVAFISWERLPGRKFPTEPVPQIVPNLAVEVLSESNTEAEIARKRREYFEAGVELVWIVDPPARVVRVYTAPEQFSTLTVNDTLTGEPVLPGFTLKIRTLFAEIES
jgi:Uma2 family endonuclease